MADGEDWYVACSDEELYYEKDVEYELDENNRRIWVPNQQTLNKLFLEIEKNGNLTLAWQCPGRISPSQYEKQKKQEEQEPEQKPTPSKNDAKSEFDFDNDFDDEDLDDKSFVSLSAAIPKRSFGEYMSDAPCRYKLLMFCIQTGLKKSQTDLSSVMQNIKKYQAIDTTEKSSSGFKFKSPEVKFDSDAKPDQKLNQDLDKLDLDAKPEPEAKPPALSAYDMEDF